MPEIIVEDGSGVEGANSYLSIEELTSFADDRGLKLPEDDETKGKFLIRAFDYLEAMECKFIGQKTEHQQKTAWPRDLSSCNGYRHHYRYHYHYHAHHHRYLSGNSNDGLEYGRNKGFPFKSDEIPDELKKATAQLVVELEAGTELFGQPLTSTNQGLVTLVKLGPMEQRFSDSGRGLAASQGPIRIPSVEQYLRSLFVTGGGLKTVRA